MDKKKIKLLVTGLLALIFIIVMINSIKTIMQRKQAVNYPVAPAPVAVSKPPAAVNEPAETVDKPAKPQEEQKSEMKIYRDPFRRQAKQAASGAGSAKSAKGSIAGGVLLTGIVYDIKNPPESYCIINGQSLKQGDFIAGFIITNISEDFVILNEKKENKDYKLDIWGQLEEIL